MGGTFLAPVFLRSRDLFRARESDGFDDINGKQKNFFSDVLRMSLDKMWVEMLQMVRPTSITLALD